MKRYWQRSEVSMLATPLRNRRAIALFVGPALLVYTAVMLIPIIWSLGYSVYSGSILAGFKPVGLQNYQELFKDPVFWQALTFTLKYAVTVTIGQVTLGLLLSFLYVFGLRQSSGLVRTLVFFPVVIPTVAVAQMFSKLFEITPQYGLVNGL